MLILQGIVDLDLAGSVSEYLIDESLGEDRWAVSSSVRGRRRRAVVVGPRTFFEDEFPFVIHLFEAIDCWVYLRDIPRTCLVVLVILGFGCEDV